METETIGGIAVVHNYGHGGFGYQASWGCSAAAVKMIREALEKKAEEGRRMGRAKLIVETETHRNLGGLNYLSTQHDWAMNSVVAFDVVLASGAIVKASSCENADLFNALRGGGNAYGIVTTFTIRARKIGELIFLFYDGETPPPGTFDIFTNIGPPLLNMAKTQYYSTFVSAPRRDRHHWQYRRRPIPKRLARHAKENGGDLLNLDDSVDRLLVELNYAYNLPSSMPQIERALKSCQGRSAQGYTGSDQKRGRCLRRYFYRLRPEKSEYLCEEDQGCLSPSRLIPRRDGWVQDVKIVKFKAWDNFSILEYNLSGSKH
ncbi:hypothetical protein ACJ72_04614 [Emergomyces africanus]|uniref:FAD-binding PCMH-type domain-containing protein n=1 Tax=Emergomyces africanus TaxID=1955775 RepID=A0A1B7NW94_9EURO|nr:hypothetical protein ACJ72_04614 [Emergomyces africanus]